MAGTAGWWGAVVDKKDRIPVRKELSTGRQMLITAHDDHFITNYHKHSEGDCENI